MVKYLNVAPQDAKARFFWEDVVVSIDVKEFSGRQIQKHVTLANLIRSSMADSKGESEGSQVDGFSGLVTEKTSGAVMRFLANMELHEQTFGILVDSSGTELVFLSSNPLVHAPQPRVAIIILGGPAGIPQPFMQELSSSFSSYEVPLLQVSITPSEQDGHISLACLQLQEDAGRLKAAVSDLQQLGPDNYKDAVAAAEEAWFETGLAALTSNTLVPIDESDEKLSEIAQEIDEETDVSEEDKVSQMATHPEQSEAELEGQGSVANLEDSSKMKKEKKDTSDAKRTPSSTEKGLPSVFVAGDSVWRTLGRKAAAQAVKEIQRRHPAGNVEWWAYCNFHNNSLHDPCRHTLPFLRRFLEEFHGGYRRKFGKEEQGKSQASFLHPGPQAPPGLEVPAASHTTDNPTEIDPSTLTTKYDQSMLLDAIRLARHDGNLANMDNMKLCRALAQLRENELRRGAPGGVQPVTPIHPTRVRTAPEFPPVEPEAWEMSLGHPAKARSVDSLQVIAKNRLFNTLSQATPVGLINRNGQPQQDPQENQTKMSRNNTSVATFESPACVRTAPDLPVLWEDSEFTDHAAKSRARSKEHRQEFMQPAQSANAMASARNLRQPTWPSDLPYPLPIASTSAVLQQPDSGLNQSENSHLYLDRALMQQYCPAPGLQSEPTSQLQGDLAVLRGHLSEELTKLLYTAQRVQGTSQPTRLAPVRATGPSAVPQHYKPGLNMDLPPRQPLQPSSFPKPLDAAAGSSGFSMDQRPRPGDVASARDRANLMQQLVKMLMDGNQGAPTNQQVPIPNFL
jgi:hypothetical protein